MMPRLNFVRQIIWIFVVIWGLACSAILLTTSGIINNDCGAVLQFQLENGSAIDRHIYDFGTGLTFREEQENINYYHAPNGQYYYDIPWYTGNDNDVFVIAADGIREQVYSSPFITSVVWSHNSQSLLIWEFDGTREITTVTSLDVETQQVRFRHEFPPTLGRRRLISPDNQYVYAQYPLDVMQFTFGIMFVDTGTGKISRFAEPSEFPYLWSEDNQWVASHFQDMLMIVDPETGNFHPQFPEPILGENHIWHGDKLWFTRTEGVWQADITTGEMVSMIANVSLRGLSADAGWATLINNQTGDMELYEFATDNHLPLNIVDLLATHRIDLIYSPDNTCAALLLSEYQNLAVTDLRIINLRNGHINQRQEIYSDYSRVEWIQTD